MVIMYALYECVQALGLTKFFVGFGTHRVVSGIARIDDRTGLI